MFPCGSLHIVITRALLYEWNCTLELAQQQQQQQWYELWTLKCNSRPRAFCTTWEPKWGPIDSGGKTRTLANHWYEVWSLNSIKWEDLARPFFFFFFFFFKKAWKTSKEQTKSNKGKNKGVCVTLCGLAIYIKKYLKAKEEEEELWKLKYFTMQKYY
jgi:hypothetical protein